MTKIMKWIFETVLRKKLGLKKGPPGPNVKWHESENVWMGIIVGVHGIYQVVRLVAPMISPDLQLPEISDMWLATASTVLGGGIVWSRVTAERTIKK